MVHQSTILGVVALVGLGLVAGIPIPSPTSFAHYNYVQPGPGSFHYTVIHPPHPDHKFYTVPLAYTKPLYIYNPFQHHILLVDNNLQVQAPALDAKAPAVPEPKQELALPEVDAAAAGETETVPKEETHADADDDVVAIEADDAKPEGREEAKEDVVEAVKGGNDEEDLEGGAKKAETEEDSEKDFPKDDEEPEKIESEAPKEETDSVAKSDKEDDAAKDADYGAEDDTE